MWYRRFRSYQSKSVIGTHKLYGAFTNFLHSIFIKLIIWQPPPAAIKMNDGWRWIYSQHHNNKSIKLCMKFGYYNGLWIIPEIQKPEPTSNQHPRPFAIAANLHQSSRYYKVSSKSHDNAFPFSVSTYKLPGQGDPSAANPKPMPRRQIFRLSNICGSQGVNNINFIVVHRVGGWTTGCRMAKMRQCVLRHIN